MQAVNGREGAVNEILDRGRWLSLLRPIDFRTGDTPADGGERNAGSSPETDTAASGEDADGQGESVDERTPHADDNGEGEGDSVG